jgi:AcrR family transcriptional regulator
VPGRRRAAYHHGDVPRALVDAAADLIAQHGADGFTLRQAARRVGVNHTAAYRHFADKRAVVAAVAERGYRVLGTRMRAAARTAGSSDPTVRIARIIGAFVRFALSSPHDFRVMFGPRLNIDGRFPSLEAAIADVLELLVGEIERGIAAGTLRDGNARDLALGLWVMAQGYADMVLERRIAVRSQAVALRYFGALLAPFLDGIRR